MKQWSVWSEGYSCTGEHSGATYHGDFYGNTFAEACAAWAKSSSQPEYFDPVRLTYWGCRMFDNESEARKGFG